MMKSSPDVLIQILNFNKKDYLIECLASVFKLRYEAFDVVVVDNASTDDSVDAIKRIYPQTRIIQSDWNRGVACGRNFGTGQIGNLKPYDYLFFLDDDTEVSCDSLGHLIHAFEGDPDAGVVCGTAVTSFPPETLMSCGIHVNLFLARVTDRESGRAFAQRKKHSQYVDAGGGFAFLVRRKLFERLEFFDERYSPYGWEDVDFCLRAREIGYKTKYVPEALLCHKGTRLGRKPVPKYEKSKIRSFLKLVKRHATPIEKISCALFIPLRGAKLVMTFMIKGEWKTVLAMLRSIRELL